MEVKKEERCEKEWKRREGIGGSRAGRRGRDGDGSGYLSEDGLGKKRKSKRK